MTAAVTVGVPVYNGERYLQAALDSVRNQTFPDLEILIADNGSTDGTEAICRAAMAEDSRVRYLRSEVNLGGPRNMNRLYQNASAPLFKWAFYDDLCGEDLIADCVAALQNRPDHVGANPRVKTIDAAGVVTGEHDDAVLGLDRPTAHERLSRLYVTMAEQALFGVIRTAALRRTQGIQPTLSDGYVLLTELLVQGPFAPVDAQSLFMRVHEQQHGGDRRSELRWLGPGRRNRVLAYTRVNVRLARAVLDADLPSAEKGRCLAAIGRDWTLRKWRSSASDFKHLVSDLRTA